MNRLMLPEIEGFASSNPLLYEVLVKLTRFINQQGGVLSGAGSPENEIAAQPSTIYLSRDPETGEHSFWVKDTGFDKAGWKQMIAMQGKKVGLVGEKPPTDGVGIGGIQFTDATNARLADPRRNLAAHVSYRPTTNPLTATDAGATATINVAAFTQRVAGVDIAVNSGTVTGVGFDLLRFTRYDDANFAGGAVTYVAEATKEDALNGTGRFFIGSIRTPKDGGIDTVGNNDGGTGAQFDFRGGIGTPKDNALGGGGAAAFTNPNNAQDGDLATFAFGIDDDAANQPKGHVWRSIQQIGWLGPATVTLKVRSEVIKTGAGVVLGRARYSINGGTTFTTLFSTAVSRALQTDSVDLSGASLSNIQVDALADWLTGASTSVEVRIHDIWVEVVAG